MSAPMGRPSTVVGETVVDKESGLSATILGYMEPKDRGWATYELWTVRRADGAIVQRTREQLEG